MYCLVSTTSNASKVTENLIHAKINPEPISCHWSLSIPSENIRKPLVF